jgi:ribosomal protein L11 methyltransferase|tara:strand:- start:4310 stop:5191 length:882 start_codon:yes stop_codon:yes gene_type:complete
MPWIQLIIDVTPTQTEALEDGLLELGAASVTYQDKADQPIYEPLPGETPLWNKTTLTAMFEAETDITSVIAALKPALGFDLPKHKVEILEDKDWVREWMKDYHAICFGQRLWICPSWQQPPEPSAVNLMLDPGLAFGSGTHPTTALCMRWLDGQELTGKTVIDYGCGSGVLAVAALLLGASSAHCVDIDPQALIATLDNANRNKLDLAKIYTAIPADFDTSTSAEVVIANILATPLIELSSLIASLVKPQGDLILSGILPQQAATVMQAYAQWIDFEPPLEDDGWIRLAGKKQ